MKNPTPPLPSPSSLHTSSSSSSSSSSPLSASSLAVEAVELTPSSSLELLPVPSGPELVPSGRSTDPSEASARAVLAEAERYDEKADALPSS